MAKIELAASFLPAVTILASGGSQLPRYDNLGRLTDEVFDHWDNSLDYRDRFTYDPAGNRVEKSRDAGRDGSVDARTAYRFDVNDRLINELAYGRTSDPESRTTYTYDYTQNTGYSRERFVNGSSSTRPTLTHVYTYDLQGRLFTATVTNYNDAGTASSCIATIKNPRFRPSATIRNPRA